MAGGYISQGTATDKYLISRDELAHLVAAGAIRTKRVEVGGSFGTLFREADVAKSAELNLDYVDPTKIRSGDRKFNVGLTVAGAVLGAVIPSPFAPAQQMPTAPPVAPKSGSDINTFGAGITQTPVPFPFELYPGNYRIQDWSKLAETLGTTAADLSTRLENTIDIERAKAIAAGKAIAPDEYKAVFELFAQVYRASTHEQTTAAGAALDALLSGPIVALDTKKPMGDSHASRRLAYLTTDRMSEALLGAGLVVAAEA